jgi:hypothetical protein
MFKALGLREDTMPTIEVGAATIQPDSREK